MHIEALKKLTVVLVITLGAACSSGPRLGWDEFVGEAHEYLTAKQDVLRDQYGLNDYERYDWDQDTGQIEFSNGGVIGLRARIVIVGSTSSSSGTWLWAWDNSSIDTDLTTPLVAVRRFGEAKRFDKLVQPKWNADDTDGWEMTSASAFLLKAEGAYQSPDETGSLYLLLYDVEQVK